MDAPSPEKINELKARFPGRVLRLVELVDGDEAFSFVITGPNREEYKKFRHDLVEAGESAEKLHDAAEKAALAQIRWPDRDTVRELFDAHPAFPMSFAGELTKAAGAHVEVRAKNL